jgi:hypothetical protein
MHCTYDIHAVRRGSEGIRCIEVCTKGSVRRAIIDILYAYTVIIGSQMYIKLIMMRAKGVQIPRRMLSDRYTVKKWGQLTILDTTDQGLRRTAKVARLTIKHPGYVIELVDPHILWANENKFVLSGFERVRDEHGNLVDYAQSWLCEVELERKEEAPKTMPREAKKLAREERS